MRHLRVSTFETNRNGQHSSEDVTYLRRKFNYWKLNPLIRGEFHPERFPCPCIFDALFNAIFCSLRMISELALPSKEGIRSRDYVSRAFCSENMHREGNYNVKFLKEEICA
jgi:hypothetical protein